MKIAMIGPFGFHPNKTMRARAFQLAQPLAQRGHQVKMMMPPWQTPQESGRSWQEAGVEIVYVPVQGGIGGITYQLLKAVLAFRPEVVHCFKPKAYSGLVAWWLWQFHRHKLRLVVDSDDWEGWGGWNELAPYSKSQKLFFAWQEKWGMAHCHALTVASRALQTLAWGNGLRPGQVSYLPNGPGIAAPSGRDKRPELGLSNRPLLLLYSRLFEFNTGRLVAILSAVCQTIPDLAILAVGSGLYQSDAAQLRQQLAQANLLGHVTDLGWLAENDLPDTLAAADVGLYLMDDNLLNRTKCPVKLADMLAAGVPIVAEQVGQVSEYVQHQQTGWLCPSGDVAGVTAGLIHLLQNPPIRHQLSKQAQLHIQTHFSWATLATQAEQLYNKPS